MKLTITKSAKYSIIAACLLMVAVALIITTKPVSANKDSNVETKQVGSEQVVENTKNIDSIIVGGGCFWCVESDFEPIEGVIQAISGYINGNTENPTYQQVSRQVTGHYEAVKIEFDTNVISAQELLDYFWKTIDPTDAGGQFCDRGSPYKTGLFYQNQKQKDIFNASLTKVKQTKPFSADIVTPVLEAQKFYTAEEYHQDYYLKNPLRYKLYRGSCRRDKTVERLWGEVASKKYH